MKRFTHAKLFSCVAAAALTATGVHAQTTEPIARSEQSTSIADIVVTAQRRSERLQDVPVAVTAVKGEALRALNVESVLDLNIAAPSLNTSNSNSYFTSNIRGIGSGAYAAGAESQVALYVDGVYLAAPIASELSLAGIESIEVLKGPQGTLFGRNATAGLIHVITRSPSDTATGTFNLSYGNYDTLTGNGYISGPLGEGLAADLAVSGATQGDGFGRNRVTGADTYKLKHDIIVRSKIAWTPGPDTKVTLTGNFWDGSSSRGGVVNWPGKLSGFVPGRVGPDIGYDADVNDAYRSWGWSAGGSLRIEHDFGGVALSSISAYRKGISNLSEDLDFSPLDQANLFQQQSDRQISQELQLSSSGSGPLKWTAGVFYFDLKSVYQPIIVDFANQPGVGARITIDSVQTAKSIAGYGQATYEVANGTNITLGGRYTSEDRAEKDAFQTTEIPAIGLTIPQAFPTQKVNASKFTYRISLDHRFSEQAMAYASFNTGFKSGGYNSNGPGTAPYRPETLKAYEVGLKTDLLDRHLRINLSGFYYDYSNIQVQRIAQFSLIVVNGASARIYGLDADFTAVMAEGFTLTGGLNLINPEFEKFPNCPTSTAAGGVPLVPGSCDNKQLPFAAKFSGNVAANYKANVSGGELTASGNVYYNSGYYFESDNQLRQSRFAKLGASLNWRSASGIKIGVFGRNLTNRRTATFGATQAGGNPVIAYADPRTYGATVGFEF
ncbi:MAG: TonB-dependent receptor [Sphingobium sp.]|uniref:TonB-dependent receptor n=1 Tax=Sphingobium sp. TaxID=1912891 RepID=UPI0029B58ABF|nr:TonB-dependent receptor [Sphingobium sp.]MDX3911691.1 TonB-dependent receptor [Sphingobium sp.]